MAHYTEIWRILTVSSGEILAAGEASTRPGGGISPCGKHGNTAVLELDATEVIEALLVGHEAERIPAAELGAGGANFVVEGSVDGRGGLGRGSGGEGGGGADKSSDDGGLHG